LRFNDARWMTDELIAHSQVRRSYLGLAAAPRLPAQRRRHFLLG
jgi:hypothetical protein